MKRDQGTMKISALKSRFVEIEFPEYQREPDVWSRKQKQRLIDSILRDFDIASIYLYCREDDGLECIDGRQRLNAIMSFLRENPADQHDNGFALKIENEISSGLSTQYQSIDGKPFDEIRELAQKDDETAQSAVNAIESYLLTVVYLSGAEESDEFNLQFLRLNLGTLINAGEKLNAMVGKMRDLLFESEDIGRHPFFNTVDIPTRRFARELTAGQVILQAFEKRSGGEFTRARHFDLQKFVKAQEGTDVVTHPVVKDVSLTLTTLQEELSEISSTLRNRAIAVTVVLLAWERRLWENDDQLSEFKKFMSAFLKQLGRQVHKMKRYEIDDRFRYLVDFQRHLTQASVEKPAVTKRHEILDAQFAYWLDNGKLSEEEEDVTDTGP